VIGGKRSIPVGELRAVVSHVRELEAKSHRASRVSIWTYALLFVILLGSIRVGASSAYLTSSLQTNEESRMRTLQNLGVVSSIAIASVATAQNAVQWRIEDGGNGHWYGSTAGLARWPEALSQATAAGGNLVSITSAQENTFIATAFAGERYWIGARRATTVASAFIWADGSVWSFDSWEPGEPNTCNPCGEALYAQSLNGLWDDTGFFVNGSASNPGYRGIIEWSADCNSDGIVDFGQIQAGALVDTDGNNIPDCCQSSQGCDACPADVNGSGSVTGADLAAVLSLWGTDGGKFSRADVNGDGFINGVDLAEVLNAWGPCP